MGVFTFFKFFKCYQISKASHLLVISVVHKLRVLATCTADAQMILDLVKGMSRTF